MKGPVRAKFRCLGVTQKWDKSWQIELGPVMQRGKNSEENRKFWECSPTGECHLFFHQEHPFEPGAYYYIDMVPNDAGVWELQDVTKRSGGSGEVFFSHYRQYDYQQGKPVGLLNGHLKIGVDGNKTQALQTWGDPGSHWDVTFTFAEPSDEP